VRRLPLNRRLVGSGALALVAGVTAAVLAVTLTGSSRPSVSPRSLGVIDAKRGSVVGDVGLASTPTAVAAGEGAVWAISRDDKTVTRVDPRSRAVVKTVGLSGIPSDLAVGDGAVWVLHSSSSQPTSPGAADARVSRIDPGSYVVDTIDPETVFDDVTYEDPIAVGPGVWISSTSASAGPGARGLVSRIAPSPAHAVRRFYVPRGASALAADADSAWAATGAGVLRLSPIQNPILPVEGTASLGPRGGTVPDAIAVGRGYVWAVGQIGAICAAPPCGPGQGLLWRVDPGLNVVQTQTLGSSPGSIAVGAGAVWVAVPAEKEVWKIDPDSLDVLAKIDLGAVPRDLAVLGRFVWVAVGE
jgi:hypothetical protein